MIYIITLITNVSISIDLFHSPSMINLEGDNLLFNRNCINSDYIILEIESTSKK